MRSAASKPVARIDRVVVRAPGDATTGARIAERLPARLTAALREADPSDERGLRALIEQAAREAAR